MRFLIISRTDLKKILFALLFTLGACSTAPKAPSTPSSLASITINSNVDVAGKPQLKTGTETIDKALAKLGADWPEEHKRKFQDFVEPVHIQELVKQSVHKEISKTILPVPILESNGEANLKFTVETYGFDQALEGLKLPLLELKAELIKEDGRVIWDDSESIDRRDQFKTGVNVRSWFDYQNNPALMSADFSSVTDILVKEIFEKLKKDYASGDIDN